MSGRVRVRLAIGLLAIGLLASRGAAADIGFQLERYEPTAAGEWTFAVERPWYSDTRYFAGGLTLDYGHNPLVLSTQGADGTYSRTTSVVEHQLVGHLDLAGSFYDRILIAATLPVTLLERGTEAGGFAALGGAAVGDPRVSVTGRLYGKAEKDRFSLHLGVAVWIPVGAEKNHAGDAGVRVLPRITIAGLLVERLRYTFNIGYLIRSGADLATTVPVVSTAGQELQFGLALGYGNKEQTWNVGPEIALSSVMTRGQAFSMGATSLEALLGGQIRVWKGLQLGAAIGVGALRQPGTPDVRTIIRLAWAPVRELDTDGDGIVDKKDACPTVKGIRTEDPKTNGCPPPQDRDGDTVLDPDDVCPDTHMGPKPDPDRRGCPLADRDQDDVPDKIDVCPDTHKGARPDPDPKRLGCPTPDRDGDGVLDPDDLCPDVPQGDKPDPKRLGCPYIPTDRDGDGVFDDEDVCPDVPAGFSPDPDKKGCPAPDRDNDRVPDRVDACPDVPGAPDPDPKKNGCPGLVQIRNCKIDIALPVFFATDKDVILPRSFGILTAVKIALALSPQIRRVSVEGHTDSQGKREHNLDLSDRRARSVMNWLAKTGIEAGRLESHGYGPDRPVAPNATAMGRAKNRRVEFRILEPKCEADKKEVVPPEPARSEQKTGKVFKGIKAKKIGKHAGGTRRAR